MAATNYAYLVAAIRAEADDTEASNPMYGQTAQGTVDGTNTLFKLPDTNIISDPVNTQYNPWLISGSPAVRSQSGFTYDPLTGYVTLGSAPAAGSNPPLMDYYFNWYVDADYNTFIDRATEDLGGVAGVAVIEGLWPALIYYSLARYFKRRATSHAYKYQTSGGSASANPTTPAQNFRQLAKDALAAAIVSRDDYYKRQGQRNAPASGTITYGISRYTPRR